MENLVKNYSKINTALGWIVFAIASFVYLSTMEPTTSFWDCGEYISTAYKLEVGHPPGAPLFNLAGRFFTLFASGPSEAAKMVNAMSALSSAFTILFLFWTITALARKLSLLSGPLNAVSALTIFGAGIVGSLAYTFSDSFWFSAVEGEVYAMSSFFTAIVFWAILKWESIADEDLHDERWLVLIAYLMGLSIGVHLLNLLAIPAIVFVYFFKKFPVTRNSFVLTLIISVVLLGLVQAGIIPGIVSWAARFELFFVNTLGLPFNSGTIFYFILLLGMIVFGLFYSHKKGRRHLNTAILSFAMLLLGYSSFFVLVIRSQANTPMDENNPENAINLLSYLNREQYGDWPILYGQYYNAPLNPEKPYKDGNPVYTKDETAGKYVITQDRKGTIPNYDPKFCTIFPRMHSDQRNHVAGYKEWADIKGSPVRTTNARGEPTTIYKPTFGENLKFFFSYQLGHMYARYFMWNFVGRQNDTQGHGSVLKGNWLSGIKPIDAIRLGPQENLPESFTSNKGYNRLYFLPLILGLLGMFFHFRAHRSDGFVVFLLFMLTGVAIIIYLNNTPYQPRERDYGYVGSFYAFSIWIGLSVFAIRDFLVKRKIPVAAATMAGIVLGLLGAPTLMAAEGWDDHDRSNRYTARDFAFNYLNSCAPNAILFTNGDNDTFPLWYAQEVEGFRTDVRVVNLSLSNTDWYIEQMRRKAYDSDPVPLTLTEEQYRQGTRDYLPVYYNPQLKLDTNRYYNVKDIISFVGSEDPAAKISTQSNMELNYIPVKKIFIPADSAQVVNNGTVPPELAPQILDGISLDIDRSYVMKNDLMILDILATNNWKRPVYFAITVGDDAYLNLDPYFQLEGLAYRLLPVRLRSADGQTGKVNTKIMYENMMKKFVWGGLDKNTLFMDENNQRMTMNLRNNFARLAQELIREGKKDKAKEVLDYCMKKLPLNNVSPNFFLMPLAECYYQLDMKAEGDRLCKLLFDQYEDELAYYSRFKGRMADNIDYEKQQAMGIMQRLVQLTGMYKQDALSKDFEARLNQSAQ
jgi:hypothetical protein